MKIAVLSETEIRQCILLDHELLAAAVLLDNGYLTKVPTGPKDAVAAKYLPGKIRQCGSDRSQNSDRIPGVGLAARPGSINPLASRH
jgi:hypothetical protein